MYNFLNNNLNNALKQSLLQCYHENNEMDDIFLLIMSLCYNKTILCAGSMNDYEAIQIRRKISSFLFQHNLYNNHNDFLDVIVYIHANKAHQIFKSHMLSEYYKNE